MKLQFENAQLYKEQVRRLYISAFPPEERPPLRKLFQRARQGKGRFFAVTEEGRFVGLAYTIQSEALVYLFFLAVEEAYRGQGCGTQMLKQIIAMYPDRTMILSIEDPDDESAENLPQRLRRIPFYENCGFRRLPIKTREAGVVYAMMGTSPDVDVRDYYRMMRRHMGRVMFRLIFRDVPKL